jgi:hypothetical protein
MGAVNFGSSCRPGLGCSTLGAVTGLGAEAAGGGGEEEAVEAVGRFHQVGADGAAHHGVGEISKAEQRNDQDGRQNDEMDRDGDGERQLALGPSAGLALEQGVEELVRHPVTSLSRQNELPKRAIDE